MAPSAWASLAAVLMLAAGPSLLAAPNDPETALADRIDQLIEARLHAEGVKPAKLADDGEFLRRVCLDLIGRIPSRAEAQTFLDDHTPDKRGRLVRTLLKSPGYVSHFTNVWRDLLLPEAASSLQPPGQQDAFDRWLKSRLEKNVGYDRMVRELLTTPFSSPRLRQRRMMARPQQTDEPSAAAFYLAKDVKPENLASSTARLFLGVRLDCAQCHDHPAGLWTRQQFWGYAAFFAGLQRDNEGGGVRELFDRRELAIPGSVTSVEARFLDGSEPQWRFNTGARTTLADWITAPENPYFARAAANRLWAYLFGVGLVEPVDDLRPSNPASHPQLLDELARQLTAHHFDVPFLIRVLTSTRAYQRSSAAAAGTDSRLFAHRAIKGLTPEQLFDSLSQATGSRPPEDAPDMAPRGRRPDSLRDEVLARFRRQGQSPTEAQLSIPQALTLMNSPRITEAIRCKGGTVQQIASTGGLDSAGRIEALTLAALSRRPTPREKERFARYLENAATDGSPQALGDVLWVLLNSPEFLLNH